MLDRQPPDRLSSLEEIRAYSGRALELVCAGKPVTTGLTMDAQRMDNLLSALSGYALYRFERELAQGYLPIDGGHRAGVCGRMVLEDGTWRMTGITSLCIRIGRHIPGASMPVRRQLMDAAGRVRRVLFLGAPGCGKTTVLRDAAIYLAQEKGMHVAAADEREELFACRMLENAGRIDVMAGVDKARAMGLILRSMAPQVIVTDEIGKEADAAAIADAVRCGVGVLASAHAGGFSQCLKRPVLRQLIDARAFERYILLDRQGGQGTCCVWDEDGRALEREQEDAEENEEGNGDGKWRSGCDGDDRDQRDSLSDFGWRAAARALDSGDAQVSAEDQWDDPV